MRYIVALAIVVGTNTIAAWGLYTHGFFVRMGPATAETFDRLGRGEPLRSYPDVEYFRHELTRPIGITGALRWTMNQTNKVSAEGEGLSAWEAVAAARSGAGLDCRPLAEIFQHALAAQGHRSRPLRLVRSIFQDGDSHVTTEVLLNDRWVVFDPTLGVSFQLDGRLLSAAEIQKALFAGEDVVPVFHGAVRYPVRLETYYIPWTALYNSLLLFEDASGWWGELPPLRYWFGPRYHYLTRDGSAGPIAVVDGLYFATVVVGPLVSLLLLILALRQRLGKPAAAHNNSHRRPDESSSAVPSRN